MENLEFYHDLLKELKLKAKRLNSTGLSLIVRLAQETSRLNREDEAYRLKALLFSVKTQLGKAENSEDSAANVSSKVDLILSLGGLGVGTVIQMLSKNKQPLSYSNLLLTGLGTKQRPFGNVLVCIGTKGIPDDVRGLSISRLARESDRVESEVINELLESGCLLIEEKVFSLLIDKLINEIREGRLHLPISRETLSQIGESGLQESKAKDME